MTTDRTQKRPDALRAAVEVPLSLVVVAGSNVTRVRVPERGELTIGRDATCDLSLDDASVSRRHARVLAASPPVVEDLGSTNGTRVSGVALAAGTTAALRVGTLLEVGAFAVYVQRAEAGDVTRARVAPPQARNVDTPVHRDMVLESNTMREAYALIDVVKDSKMSVIVLGETGVGKDVYAEALHRASARGERAYVRLNCAALPENLLEAELFGYEKGAFTGAVAAKPGLFESADGGTVFLDEIGEMPLVTQAKLLRVLENGEVMRIGALKSKRVDVRFVSATHRDLEALVAVNQFREDLYYRLNGVSVVLAPLRDRRDEIVPLAHFFLARTPGAAQRLSSAAEARLLAYRWPGNVRELRNVVERAQLLARGGEIGEEHVVLRKSPAESRDSGALPQDSFLPPLRSGQDSFLPPLRSGQDSFLPPLRSGAAPIAAAPLAPGSGNMRAEIASLEKDRILAALDECGGNQSRAAKKLGISRTTLIKRLEDYGVVRPRRG